MPKKHQQRSLLTKPSASASSSLSLSRSASAQNEAPTERTVNDLIRESRRGQGHDQGHLRYQSSSSIPPTLRSILDIPVPPPPPPRAGLRGPTRLRRIPGPPPPKGWLIDSRHAPKRSSRAQSAVADSRMRITTQSCILPGGKFPSSRSFQHLLLKQMALNWKWHVEFDHTYLTELPMRMREILLSYLTIYNDGIGPNPIRVLFPADDDQDERSEVMRLDLGSVIGGWATVKSIDREIFPSTSRLPAIQKTTNEAGKALPDTWDESDEDNDSEPSNLLLSQPTVKNHRFSNLKHLSLAATPGTPAPLFSWHDLLSLAVKAPTIVSLSLAYWPQPTYTPNASSGRFKVQDPASGSAPGVIYGGSDFYTAFDNNWREAAGILRALSRALYCLKWLDLTGCGEWFPALVWKPDDDDDDNTGNGSSGNLGPEWNGAWRDLEHLTLAVGWDPGPAPVSNPSNSTSPTRTSEESARYAAVTAPPNTTTTTTTAQAATDTHIADVLSQLTQTRLGNNINNNNNNNRRTPDPQPESWDVEFEREKYHHRKEIERYMELSNSAKKVAQDLRVLRKAHGGRWIDVDFGQQQQQQQSGM